MLLNSHEGQCCGAAQTKIVRTKADVESLDHKLRTYSHLNNQPHPSRGVRVPVRGSQLHLERVTNLMRDHRLAYSVLKRASGSWVVMAARNPVFFKPAKSALGVVDAPYLPTAKRGNTVYGFGTYNPTASLEDMVRLRREAMLTCRQLTQQRYRQLQEGGLTVGLSWVNPNTRRTINWWVPQRWLVETWRDL